MAGRHRSRTRRGVEEASQSLHARGSGPAASGPAAAEGFRDQPGLRIQLCCPPNPDRTRVGTVWGAEVYTDDSAVCPAAVHAGKLPFGRGGSVTIEIRPGQASYRGTDWNGVVSQPYGEWGGSFVVL